MEEEWETWPTTNRRAQTGRTAPDDKLYVRITSVDNFDLKQGIGHRRLTYSTTYCAELLNCKKKNSFIFLTRYFRLTYRTRNIIEHGEQSQSCLVISK